MNLKTHYFVTSSNFDHTGSTVAPVELTSYAKLQTDLNFDFTIIDRLGFFGRGTWQYINLKSTINAGTAFGFGDQTAGLVLRIIGISPDAPFTLDLQGQVDVPGYSNSTSLANSTPYMGDGSIDLTSGIFTQVTLKEGRSYKFQTLLGAGYTYRSDGYSAALPWSVFLKLIPQLNGLTLDAGVTGTLSMRTDMSPSYSTPHSNLISGGSFITGAVDPSILQFSIQPGYRFAPELELDAFGTLSLWGQNVPASFSLACRLQILFGKVKEGRIEKHLRAVPPSEPDPTGDEHPQFTTYSLDASIVNKNDRMNLVKINKGSQDGIVPGQIFDIFNVKVSSENGEAIARGEVISVKAEEAALEVTEFYKEAPIEEGFIAKRLIQ